MAKKFLVFYGIKSSLPYLQALINVSILSHIYPIQNAEPIFLKTLCNIILPSRPLSSKLSHTLNSDPVCTALHVTYHFKQHKIRLLITGNEVFQAVYLAFCNIKKRLEEIKLLFLSRWKCFQCFVHNGNTLRSQFVLCNFTSILEFHLPMYLVLILLSLPRATVW